MSKTYHQLTIRETLKELGSSPQGLSFEEVQRRFKKYGPNKLPERNPLSRLRLFLEQLRSPLINILLIAGIITLILKEYTDSIVIFGAVFLNTIVGFIQEYKASRALRELKKILKIKTIVLRDGLEKEIYQEELAPGDIILLKPGDKVPADGRLIETHDLKINESVLTGEWLPAEKTINRLPKDTSSADRDNMVYMGTIVEDGRGKAVVTQTSLGTEIGQVAQIVKETKEEKTPYQKKLAHFSKIVGIVIGVICLGIFIEGMITGNRFIEMFTTSIAIAVAAIPEGLPVAMTVILALGMQRILKKKGLVRKLASAETLGSTSIILTDKTGTLTEAKMKVAGVYTGTKDLLSDGGEYNKKIDRNNKSSHILALKIATLCNEAFIENPEQSLEKWVVRGRPTDRALLLAGIQAGLNKRKLEKEMSKIDELPFNPENKYLAALYKLDEKSSVFYVSGAPEKILAMSEWLEIDGRQTRITPDKMKELTLRLKSLAKKGLRVVAVGYRKISNSQFPISNLEGLCDELVFVGFIGLHDPIRKEAKEAIKLCRQAGMRPIIVTGDHSLTAKAVAEELGFNVVEKNIIEGKDLEKLSDEELKKRIKDFDIYARVKPTQKLRIIRAWQGKGEVVAMTGDGVNDAPALKQADIGVALGSGTSVAKEVSDLVLLTDNFSIIVWAVEEGRAIIDNVKKVITYLLSDSFSEIILIGVALLLKFPLPILAVQILWVNLIEDGLPGMALAFEPKENDLMKRKPQGHDMPLLNREMKVIIFVIGLITDLLLLGLFFWLWENDHNIQHIRTMIFACLSIDSLFYVFSCKSLRRNLWHINPFSNKFLVMAFGVGVVILVLGIYLPIFQTLLKTVPLGLYDWTIVITLGMIELALIEAAKWHFIKKRFYS